MSKTNESVDGTPEDLPLFLRKRFTWLKLNFPKINMAHDRHASRETTVDDILQMIFDADRMPTKCYTYWLARRYNEGLLTIEDLDKTAGDLAVFNRYKARIPVARRNLGDHTPSTLHQMVKPFLEEPSFDKWTDYVLTAIEAGADVLHESKSCVILNLSNWKAMRRFGSNTHWCVVPNELKFLEYVAEGRLFGIYDKVENQRYLNHFQQALFNNEDDEPALAEQHMSLGAELMDFFGAEEHPAFWHPDKIHKAVVEAMKTHGHLPADYIDPPD